MLILFGHDFLLFFVERKHLPQTPNPWLLPAAFLSAGLLSPSSQDPSSPRGG